MSLNFANRSLNSTAPEYNILVMGESGTGKSTTINAIASYLMYGSFDRAQKASNFLNLIPTQFALSDPEHDEPFIVRHGSDANECPNEVGASCTQAPKGHMFRDVNGNWIRMIDTPGIGDTTGVGRDRANFDQIIQFLGKHKNLHGILILVKSNETRQNALFKYCISELFTHLPRDACRNVVFCFTYSRIDYYEPGEGFMNVRNFLKVHLPALKLEKGKNCYFIDNEAYRFLLAKQQGFPLNRRHLKSCEESWTKSAAQIQNMIHRITSLEPHLLLQTTLLDQTRKMLLNMAEPLAKLQANISENIRRIHKEEKRLQTCGTGQIEQMMKNLTFEVNDLKRVEMDYPTTVCTSDNCVEVINSNGELKTNYKTRCHERCQLQDVEVNLIADNRLKECSSMTFGICNCGCPWQKHMHITCEFVKVKRQIVISKPNPAYTAAQRLKKTIQKFRKLDQEYAHELQTIKDVTSKFAYILNEYSNWPINQYIEPYLDLMIEEEHRKMQSTINAKRTAYQSLIQMKADHQEMVQILADAIQARTQEKVRIENIDSLKSQLMFLKHSGAQFRQMIADNISSKEKGFKYLENLGLDLLQ